MSRRSTPPRSLPSHARDLRWSDVNPAGRQVPLAEVQAAVRRHLVDLIRTEGWRKSFVAEVTSVVVGLVGPWGVGWSFSVGEGSGGGGVVKAWCCESHTLPKKTPTTADLDRLAVLVRNSLAEWQAWLVRVHDAFVAFPLVDGPPPERGLALAIAISELVTLVMEGTACEDAWYAHAEQVLDWYLEHLGLRLGRPARTAWKALSGLFESWVGPPPGALNDAALAVATALVEQR